MFNTIILLALASLCYGDVSHLIGINKNYEITTESYQPNPYHFKYAAGRFPGHIDRKQQESGDGVGHVRGSFSYIDPKFKVRTVEYTADEHGFHPSLINYDDVLRQPLDSEAVKRAKERHTILYNKIAASNAQGSIPNPPRDTVSVANARDRHFNLYDKIAAEHAAIAAEREAERLAFEATSIQNDVNNSEYYVH